MLDVQSEETFDGIGSCHVTILPSLGGLTSITSTNEGDAKVIDGYIIVFGLLQNIPIASRL